ncbi:hypothetical protein [Maridesulfovibrio sp.]|uniref:hypothetical protein n=1 Tax=unclassified Maridesulfovibrio TaxID=2794999 RepID=UPI003AFFB032
MNNIKVNFQFIATNFKRYFYYFIVTLSVITLIFINKFSYWYIFGIFISLLTTSLYKFYFINAQKNKKIIKINKCFAMLVSIGGQLICYIMLTLGLVFFFAAYFEDVMDRTYKPRTYTEENCPGIEKFLTSETIEMFRNASMPVRYLNSLNASSACDDLTKNDIFKLTVNGNTKTTEDKGAQITFNFITNIEFKPGEQRKKECNSSNCTLVIKTSGKRFLNLGKEILNNKTKINAENYFLNSTVKYENVEISANKIFSTGNFGAKGKSEYNYKKSWNSTLADKIVDVYYPVHLYGYNFSGTKFIKFIRDKGKFNVIISGYLFSPLAKIKDNLISTSPLFISFTIIFTMMISVFGAYINEKVKFAYSCKAHCSRRVFLFMTLPVVGGTATIAGFIYLFSIHYHDYNIINLLSDVCDKWPTKDCLAKLLELLDFIEHVFRPFIACSITYMIIKFYCRSLSKNSPIFNWSDMCKEKRNGDTQNSNTKRSYGRKRIIPIWLKKQV